MQLGDFDVTVVSGGTLRLDGGTMFGVVPKLLWQKAAPPDEQNRIRMATNCLLVRDGKNTVLVDTGYGGKLNDRQRKINAAQEGEPLLENLGEIGVSPDEITHVALTHLHFDHCGGGTRFNAAGSIVPTFPNAQYYISRIEWELANSHAAELRGSYPTENFQVLGDNQQLTLVDGDGELLPGLRWIATPGHTAGHLAFTLESGGQKILYPCDLCPTTAHLRSHWCMAYDTDLLETRRRKPALLGQAADEGWLVVWVHDPDVVAARLERDERREFILSESLTTL